MEANVDQRKGPIIRGGAEGSVSKSANSQDSSRKGSTTSLSDTELDDDDYEGPTQMPQLTSRIIPGKFPPSPQQSATETAKTSGLFRSLYITSDYSASRDAGGAPPSRPNHSEATCVHGLPHGACREPACTDILGGKITRTEKRTTGTVTGKKIVEYLVVVEYTNCRAQIWHRYSGFRNFFYFLCRRFGEERFKMFPRKHINKWSSSVTAERIAALNLFLEVILSTEEIRKSVLFKDFLSVDENDRRQFYEAGADDYQTHKVEVKALKRVMSAKFDKLLRLEGSDTSEQTSMMSTDSGISTISEGFSELERLTEDSKPPAK